MCAKILQVILCRLTSAGLVSTGVSVDWDHRDEGRPPPYHHQGARGGIKVVTKILLEFYLFTAHTTSNLYIYTAAAGR